MEAVVSISFQESTLIAVIFSSNEPKFITI